MPKILFWNIKKRDLSKSLSTVATERQLDLICLAETGSNIEKLAEVLGTLNRPFQLVTANSPDLSGLAIFSALPKSNCECVHDASRFHAIKVTETNVDPLLLVVVHLPSKNYYNATEQATFASTVAQSIDVIAERSKIENVIVVGDFNMNPYEPGMTSFYGFHAMMTKAVAHKKARTLNGKEKRYFYNPSWSRIGDESVGPPGSFYYSKSSPESVYWHSFDQILLSPNLLSAYERGGFEILTSIGSQRLWHDRGLASGLSDHLPIFADIPLDVRI